MIRPRIKKLFRLAFHRREDAERDVRDEIRLHVELRTEQLIGGGMAPDEARRVAERKFGAIDDVRPRLEETATHREAVMRKREWMESFTQDLRYVLRSLRRSPTFVISATLTLALGLGANAALFSVLDRLYLQALTGVSAPERVKRMYLTYERNPGEVRYHSVFSPPEYIAIAAAIPPEDKIVGFRTDLKLPLGKTDDGPTGNVTWVLGDYFGTIGVTPSIGRPLIADEVGPKGSSPAAVVSNSFARTRFGSEQRALNKEFDIGALHLTIVGVMPPGFAGTELDPSDVWAPMNVRGAQFLGTTLWYEQKNTGVIRATVRVANSAALAALPAIVTAATAPTNPFVLGGVALVLLGVAVVASLVPAIRAKRIDPLEALRAE